MRSVDKIKLGAAIQMLALTILITSGWTQASYCENPTGEPYDRMCDPGGCDFSPHGTELIAVSLDGFACEEVGAGWDWVVAAWWFDTVDPSEADETCDFFLWDCGIWADGN